MASKSSSKKSSSKQVYNVGGYKIKTTSLAKAQSLAAKNESQGVSKPRSSSSSSKPKSSLNIITDSVTGNKYSRDTSDPSSTYKPYTPIDSSTLAPGAPLRLPEPPAPAKTGMDAMTKLTGVSGEAQLAANAAALEALNQPTDAGSVDAAGDQFFQTYLSSLEAPESSEKMYADIEKKAQLRQKQEKVNNFTAQLNAITNKAQADKLSLVGQGRGIAEPIIGGQQAQIDREAAIQALPIAAQLSAAQDDLEAAQDYVTTMFQIRSEDARAQREYRKEVSTAVYNYATAKQQRAIDRLEKEDDRKYQRMLTDISYARDLAGEAISNGQSSLAARIMALNPNSPTYGADLASAAGSINSLQAQLTRAQIAATGRSNQNSSSNKIDTELRGDAVAQAQAVRANEKTYGQALAELVTVYPEYSRDQIINLLDGALGSGGVDVPTPAAAAPSAPMKLPAINVRPPINPVGNVIGQIGSFLFGK